MGLLGDARLEALLDRLHGTSEAQLAQLTGGEAPAIRALATLSGGAADAAQVARERAFLADKMWALDRDKAEFCYQLARATGARRIVEAGTSFGVSTLYLAAAVRDNAAGGNAAGEKDAGVVIGTEYEPAKAARARANFAEAGLSGFVDLREGDLRETLRDVAGPVDMMLIDIWIPMARPALELVRPRLRREAVVLSDNTGVRRAEYAEYFAGLADGFRTVTLPFTGGLEMSVYDG